MNFTKTANFIVSILVLVSCVKNKDLTPGQVSTLNCGNAAFSNTATSGASYTATATLPYTEGNGVAYEKGTPVSSTGVLGLTATLEAGTLSNGSGNATYTITGVPATSGIASFAITLGGQSCTLPLTVGVSTASITGLTCTAVPLGGVNGVVYSGTVTMTYTGGNGGNFGESTATSVGVEGLTATVAKGVLANGNGTLVYTITGTPTSVGSASFNLSLGGNSCTVSVVVSAATNTTATPAKDTVVVSYGGTLASINNPYQSSGVAVAVTGNDVVVTSTNTEKEIVYLLSGTATQGSFKIYSNYKFNLSLKNVSLTNSKGPAINIQSEKKGTINILGNTINNLTDGATYASNKEDQKGTFFSEGQLNFIGNGTLNITANLKHGLVTDDYLYITESNIIVKSAVSDGIHTNDYLQMDSGSLNITSLGDGIIAEEGYIAINGGNIVINSIDEGLATTYDGTDTAINPYILIKGGKISINTTGDKANAIKSESYTTISTGESITLTVTGKGSKGIKTGGDFTLNAGNVQINTSGAAFYETADADIATPAGINTDKNLAIKGGQLTVISTGTGAKGITVDGTATISGGNTNITASGTKFTYNSTTTSEAKGFKSDGAFEMNNGELTIAATDDGIKSDLSVMVNDGKINITKSYEGIESKAITFTGGLSNITATNDGINASMGTKAGGTESNDGSSILIGGGIVIVAGSDAIDSNGNITITGGTTIVGGPTNQPEEGIDINGNFLINGGVVIAGGSNARMTKAMSAASTQVSMYITSSAQVAANSLLHIEDGTGKEMVTFKPKNANYYFHFSNPSLAKNTAYKIYFGGTYSGGNFIGNATTWGLYTGGTYSNTGASLKASPTTSGSATVNTINF